MTTRHIVALRILCTDMPGRERLFTLQNIEKQAEFCKRYTVASLRNSRNTSFDTVFLVHDRRPLAMFGPFFAAAADLYAQIVRYSEFPNFCERYRGNSELIVTRADADDCYANWVVDDIQQEAARRDSPFIYGYKKGLMYRVGTPTMRVHESKYEWGFWSCFQSLVYKKSERFARITPYSWQHQDIRKGCIPGLNDNDRKLLIPGDKEKPPFIYMRNGMQASHDDRPENDERFPRYNGRLGRKDIKEMFGVDLEF